MSTQPYKDRIYQTDCGWASFMAIGLRSRVSREYQHARKFYESLRLCART